MCLFFLVKLHVAGRLKKNPQELALISPFTKDVEILARCRDKMH